MKARNKSPRKRAGDEPFLSAGQAGEEAVEVAINQRESALLGVDGNLEALGGKDVGGQLLEGGGQLVELLLLHEGLEELILGQALPDLFNSLREGKRQEGGRDGRKVGARRQGG